MVWLNIVFNILSLVGLITSMQLKQRAMINKVLIENGLMPKYDSKKITKLTWITLISVIVILLVLLIINVIFVFRLL